ERLRPRDALPLSFAALSDALERVEDALWIVRLVVRRGTFRAVAAPAPRVRGVALELAYLERVLVGVREEPARALAVEADRRHEGVASRDLLRPRGAVVLDPIVPAIG